MKKHIPRRARGLKGCLFGKAEKNWSLFELMDTDNRILIAPYVSRSLYTLTYICRGQHAAVFSICSETVYIRVHMCVYGAVYTSVHRLCRGGGGGGGQVILKRTDDPRKDCP